MYVIGVDGGGSKTAAVVLGREGTVLGRGGSGSSNYHHVGLAQVRRTLLHAMQEASAQAGVPLEKVAAVTWALAGVDRPEEKRIFREMGAELLPGTPVRVENDAVAALIGGTGGHYGVVLIAGTGMVAYGERNPDERARAGGWGHALDRGSAYGLACAALRAVGQADDGTLPPTRLTDRLLQQLGIQRPTDLIRWLYDPGRQVAEVAALAPLILAEAEEGDLLAMEVVSQGADALAEIVDTVARRLGFWGSPFPLVLVGSLLTNNHFYRALVQQQIRTRVPSSQIIAPRYEAAVGAGLLALELLGQALDAPPVEPAAESSTACWMTEQPHLLSQDVDLRSSPEIATLMYMEAQQAVTALRPILPAVGEVIDAIAGRMRDGGRLFYIGAGSSGRLGVLDAAECPPTFNAAPGQVVGLIAGGQEALTRSIEGAEDSWEEGARAIERAAIGLQDSVIGIAASGRTPYVAGALKAARQRGALTIALVCNLPSPLVEEVDHVLAPLVGPELVTGSTRLKSGTAQKVVLNMISTGVMVRLGKVYGNLMVDLQQVNEKLRARSRRIVAQACSVDEEEAVEILGRCGGDVKVAIVSYLAACSPQEARERLARAGGVVRLALEEHEV